MKISCSRKDLLSGFQSVQGIVGSKSTLPILSNVLIETGKDCITILATDLEVAIKRKVPAKIEQEGSTTLPAKRMFNILRELVDDSVQIEVDNRNISSVASGTAFFKIIGLPKEDFPDIPDFGKEKKIKLKTELFSKILKRTSFSISHDETRYVLNGLLLSVKEGKLIAVATDGRRLAYYEMEEDIPKQIEKEIIIPAKTISELQRLIENEKEITIYFSENQVAFEMDNMLMVSRLIEGHFPNYKQVIPENIKHKIAFNAAELLSGVRRVSVMASEKSNSIKLRFSKNTLTLTSNTPEIGEAKETMAVPFDEGDVEITFNPEYMQDMLKNLDEEEVYLELIDSLSPGIIRTNTAYLYVLMPMKMT